MSPLAGSPPSSRPNTSTHASQTVIHVKDTAYFLDPKNHRDGRAPASVSHHWANSRSAGADGSGHEGFFPAIDGWLTHFVVPLVETRDRLAPKADLVVNEYIPFVNDWCNGSDASALFAKFPDLKADPASPETGCPDWRDPRATDVKINRATLGWSASAAFFAYGYGKLALLNYKYVGQDQLIGAVRTKFGDALGSAHAAIPTPQSSNTHALSAVTAPGITPPHPPTCPHAGGTWPDNEPAVSCMDWQTGEVRVPQIYNIYLLPTLVPCELVRTRLPWRALSSWFRVRAVG